MLTKYYFKIILIIQVLVINVFLSLLNSSDLKAQSIFDQLEYPYEMQKMQLDDSLIIAYANVSIDKDETILFIHGLGSYAPAWKYNVEALSKQFNCIVVDLVGYGKSSKGRYKADMGFHSRHLFLLMEKLSVPQFHIAGHSMGGQIAIHMALKSPDKVKSLTLLAPAGIETFTATEKSLLIQSTTPQAIAAVSDEQYKTNLSVNFYKMDERAEFMYSDRMLIKQDAKFEEYTHVVSEGVKGMLNEPIYDQLNAISQPTLIIYGQQDKLIPNRYLHPKLTTAQIAEEAHKSIVNSQLKTIPNAGHFVHFDQPTEVNNIITDFITNK